MVIVETPRLILRQFTSDDFDTLHEIMSDPVGMKYIGDGTPFTSEQTRDSLGKYISCNSYAWSERTLAEVPQFLRARERNAHLSMWAVIDRATGILIGRAGLNPKRFNDGQLELEVGYQLARPLWGRGFATEAARAVRNYAFDRLGFDRLISIITIGNTASERVAIKNGMRLERETIFGKTPVNIYAMSLDERANISVVPVRTDVQVQSACDIMIEAADWLTATGQALWNRQSLTPAKICLLPEKGTLFLAFIAGQPVGAFQLFFEDPIIWPDVAPGEALYIHKLAVRRANAGRGLGRCLIEHAAANAKHTGRRFLRLDCIPRPKLRGFYESVGFRHHSDRTMGSLAVCRYQRDTSL